MKSWSTPRGSDEAWRYTGLTEKRFNALAGQRRVPRLLFLVIVPPDTGAFASADEELLRLSRAAYWVWLRGPWSRSRIPAANAVSQFLFRGKTYLPLRHCGICARKQIWGVVSVPEQEATIDPSELSGYLLTGDGSARVAGGAPVSGRWNLVVDC